MGYYTATPPGTRCTFDLLLDSVARWLPGLVFTCGPRSVAGPHLQDRLEVHQALPLHPQPHRVRASLPFIAALLCFYLVFPSTALPPHPQPHRVRRGCARLHYYPSIPNLIGYAPRKRAVVFYGWVGVFLISLGGQAPHVLSEGPHVVPQHVQGAK